MGVIARGALAWVILVVIVRIWGPAVTELATPTMSAAVSLLAPDFRVLDLAVDGSGIETMLRLRVTLARTIVVDGRAVDPDPQGEGAVALPVGTTMMTLLLGLTWIAAIVPWTSPRLLLWRMAVALPVLAGMWFIDTSFSLLSLIWGFIHDNFDPQGFSVLAAWEPMMSGGGRLALGVLVGVAVAGFPMWVGGTARPAGEYSGRGIDGGSREKKARGG